MDARGNIGLSIIRSLGSKDIEVVAGDSFCFTTGSLSKYCADSLIYPSPEKDMEKFQKFILNEVKKKNYDLLIPVYEYSVIPISLIKEKLENYTKVAVESFDKLDKTLDKSKTVKIVERCGVPFPRTIIVEDVNNIKTLSREIKFPVVIKPRRKVFFVGKSMKIARITRENYVWNPKKLVSTYLKIASRLTELPMLQEYVHGDGYGVEMLINDGEEKAIFAHRRLREYPASGGASCLRESIVDKDKFSKARKIMKALEWNGVAMIEFRDDKFIEVNGRFWGSLALAIRAGLDFPYLLYEMEMNRKTDSVLKYRLGVKQRALFPMDIMWFLETGKVFEFLKSFSIHDDILSLTDPLPTIGAIREITHLFLELITRKKTMTGESV